ncbi:hypothetical protein QBC33DRAFT_93962 [Phialemonium atrogriseum]|uniref:18S rRNA factor 2 n=1 Tax=Phialemonium atrogriseum TaxID=1093897 RepID=A0AAJ0BYR5_9PEZI|nr:uncharacterized protein QBC33DRAFT_93962 [Phialemonium atrogriseum]KAK1766944.1 hypothetical protein QBC33DRAFT_93962 [Phialemonium atrogriseum]
MAPENRNHFLDADESEDDASQGYNSENELQKGGRSAKRRKIDEDRGSDDDSASEAEDEIPDNEAAPPAEQAGNDEDAPGESSGAGPVKKAEEEDKPKVSKAAKLPALSKPLGKKNLVVTDAAVKKSGVVYLSRIPPFLKPAKLRSLLEPYGKVNRTFLSPEGAAAHARRVRAGGNRKRLHTDGWVEFVDKRDARQACALLNARPIGGKKGSFYRDDVWSLRYLRGFKWDDLTQQIAAENAERDSRMRAEIGKTAKENREFVRNVGRAKMLDGIQSKAEAKKKRPRAEDGDGDGGGGGGGGKDDAGEKRDVAGAASGVADAASKGRDRKRSFKQIPLAKKRDGEQPEHVTRVLSKIF